MHTGTGGGICEGSGKFYGEFGIGRTYKKEPPHVSDTQ